ncbi:H-type lectin domain protein [Rhizoctonia solani 123E]|uniref:H-type lectin domain protein n=1 Tax=Rhizoctonia solani 123E TaxID=1423351 RepID=A0A074RYK8_9AGAM|nr:H-type lectin domain protein [Rhizoctonia solani 123E]
MSTPDFSTREIANPSDRAKHFKTILTNFPAIDIPIGINMLDIDNQFNPRIRAYIDNVSPVDNNYDRFIGRINLDAWSDTRLYAAGCTWLDASRHSLDVQFGRFSGSEMKAMRAIMTQSIDIQFTRPYQVPPKVIIWLTALDSDCRNNTRFHPTAENVTSNGFTLQIETWWDTIIHDPTTVSWIAVPSDNSTITAGRLVTGGIKASLGVQEKIVFDKPFKRIPRVMVAFNKLDISSSANIRLAAYPKDITTQGMELVINAWADTTIYSCGVGWIAIDDAPASKS